MIFTYQMTFFRAQLERETSPQEYVINMILLVLEGSVGLPQSLDCTGGTVGEPSKRDHDEKEPL